MSNDAFVLISYGSPELRSDVPSFLRNLFGNQEVPSSVLEKVTREYDELATQSGQFSPLPQQCRLLLSEILRYGNERNLTARLGTVYWGNLFWHPFLQDTVSDMLDDGVKRAVAFITSPFDSQVSRSRYLDEVERVRNEIGPHAPQIEVLPTFGTHPLYLRAVADRILAAAAYLTLEHGATLSETGTRILFTAHSIPLSDRKAESYQSQIRQAAAGVIELLQSTPASEETPEIRIPTGEKIDWSVAFQSRGRSASGSWLEPNLADQIRLYAKDRETIGINRPLLIVPIGFLLENKETAYDLDGNAMELCEELQIPAVRIAAAGVCPAIIQMIYDTAIGSD